ncbi:MAG: hypothetical protein NVS9B7_23430 [Flavisolibacter sp.]
MTNHKIIIDGNLDLIGSPRITGLFSFLKVKDQSNTVSVVQVFLSHLDPGEKDDNFYSHFNILFHALKQLKEE